MTAPWWIGVSTAEKFVAKKAGWIFEKLRQFEKLPTWSTVKHSKEEITALREQTRRLVEERLAHFNQHYKFIFHRVAIRNQKTRWGSCSKKGNLNFNYRLALLPPRLSDYIVAHELCHLAEFNHSRQFWSLVAQMVPDHRDCRRELRRKGGGEV